MTIIQWNSPLVKIRLIFLIILLGKSANMVSSVYYNESASDSLKMEVVYFDLPVYYPSTGIQFYRDGIIYLLDSKFSRESKGDYVPFGSISMYYSPLSDNKLEKQIYFLRKEPFPYPAEAVSFTADYSKIFFTRESIFRGYRDNSIRIFEAEIHMLKNGKSDLTSKPIQLPFNSKMYSCVQPAISQDGKFLIFASDMPGGQGGLDLYYSIYEDGAWENPINLGKDINSALDESFSFIDRHGNLFFSSNGHNGYGKNDIYFARLIKEYIWDKPVNIGASLNSEKDDIAFVLNRNDETQGFFASDRNVSGKQYQIFKVKIYGDIRLLSQDQPTEKESKTQIVEEGTKNIPETTIITPKTSDKTIPEIIFRVQIKASPKSLGSFNVVVNGQQYKTYEYFYKGAYRYTIGEFANLNDAIRLNQDCKKKDYSEAFVVAFRGSERVLDPQVFKK